MRVLPVTGTDDDRQTWVDDAFILEGEIHTTSDQKRLFFENNLVGPVYHGDVADEAAMLALNTSSLRGCFPMDTCYRTDTGSVWLCIAGRGDVMDTGEMDWRDLGVSGSGGYLLATNNLSDVADAATSLNNLLPDQTGNSGKFLKTDGTNATWQAIGGSGTVTSVAVASANGFDGTVATDTTTPVITITTTVTGVLKGNGTAISAATEGTDYAPGTSGLATGILKSTTTTGVLSIAIVADYPTFNQNTTGTAAKAIILATARNINGVAFDGSGDITVTADANTLSGTVLHSTVVTSSLTAVGTIGTGVWHGTAVADTYIASASAWNAKQDGSSILSALSGLTYASTSFVKMTGAATFSLDTNTYITANQTITLSGDVSGSGTTAITTTIGANKVTLGMMATLAANSIIGNNTGSAATPIALSISQTKTLLSLNNVENTALSTWAGTSNITTLGTIGTGTWNGTAIGDAYISSASTWNAKQAGSASLTSLAGLSYVSTSFVKMTATNTFALDTSTYLTTTGTGSGLTAVNAITLLTKTWAVPAAIGSTTPAAGTFTTLTASSCTISQGSLGVLFLVTDTNTDFSVAFAAGVPVRLFNSANTGLSIRTHANTGDIAVFTDGGVSVTGTLTSSSTLTATVGNIVAAAGNIIATSGTLSAGGGLNSTAVGNSTASTGAFTTLTASTSFTLNANGGALPAGLSGTIWQIGGADSTNTRMTFDCFNSAPLINFRRAQGSNASKSGVTTGIFLGQIAALGYQSGGAYGTTPRTTISFVAAENWGPTNAQGSYMEFAATAIGSNSTNAICQIASTGIVMLQGILQLLGCTTSLPSLNIPQGTAPTSPQNGDVWMTSSGLFYRCNGATVGPVT